MCICMFTLLHLKGLMPATKSISYRGHFNYCVHSQGCWTKSTVQTFEHLISKTNRTNLESIGASCMLHFCHSAGIFHQLFFFFKQAKKLLGADEKQLGVSERLTAGAMAGVASQTSIYPLEVTLFFCFFLKFNI